MTSHEAEQFLHDFADGKIDSYSVKQFNVTETVTRIPADSYDVDPYDEDGRILQGNPEDYTEHASRTEYGVYVDGRNDNDTIRIDTETATASTNGIQTEISETLMESIEDSVGAYHNIDMQSVYDELMQDEDYISVQMSFDGILLEDRYEYIGSQDNHPYDLFDDFADYSENHAETMEHIIKDSGVEGLTENGTDNENFREIVHVQEFSEVGIDVSEFSSEQMNRLEAVIGDEMTYDEISIIADSDLSPYQMKLAVIGVEQNFDLDAIELYADPDKSYWQSTEIFHAVEEGIGMDDLKRIADKGNSPMEMREMRLDMGTEAENSIHAEADSFPYFDDDWEDEDNSEIIEAFERNDIDPEAFSFEQMQELNDDLGWTSADRFGLIANPDYDEDKMDALTDCIRNGCSDGQVEACAMGYGEDEVRAIMNAVNSGLSDEQTAAVARPDINAEEISILSEGMRNGLSPEDARAVADYYGDDPKNVLHAAENGMRDTIEEILNGTVDAGSIRLENEPIHELAHALEGQNVSIDRHSMNEVRTELMDGLGLSAELSADWTARYIANNGNSGDGWQKDLRDDIKQFAVDYVQAFFEESYIGNSILSSLDYREQPQQAWEDHADYIGMYIGGEADKYLMPWEDVYNVGGYNGNTAPGDVYDLAYDLLNSTQAVFEKEAFGGNMEDFRAFCGSPDENNILHAAVSLDCLNDMIKFIGENGTVEDMQSVMADFLEEDDSKLLYDSVNDGRFTNHMDVETMQRDLQIIDRNPDLSDEEKEILCNLVIDNEILNPDFNHDMDCIGNALANDRFGQYDEHDEIEMYWNAMSGDCLPDDMKDKADETFGGLLAKCDADDDRDDADDEDSDQADSDGSDYDDGDDFDDDIDNGENDGED